MFAVKGRLEMPAGGEVTDRAHEAKRLIQRANAIIDAAGEEEDSSRDHFVADPWMEMTGWHRHLRGFDHVKLLQHVRPANGEVEAEGDKDGGQREEEEVQGEVEVPGLAEACRGTKRIIQRAFVTCTPGRIPRAVLQQVCRTETGGSVKDLRTFYSQQNVSTIRKYMEVWVEMLRYIWRTSTQEKRPRYRLTVKQEMRLQQLQQSVAKADNGTSRRKTGHREKTARRERIEAAILSFWIAMFDHELKEHEFESGVISALAVISIMRPKGGYTAAINYTPKLSAVVTVLRALVVYQAWQERQADVQQRIESGVEEREAKEQARATIEGVRESVRQFMTLTEYGGRVTPMNHILQQRTYGMAIRNTTKAPPRIGWQGDTVSIDKIKFSVEDVRTAVFGLWETARRRLVKELLFIEDEKDMPPIDIAALFDNEAEDAQGWCFLNDSRNEFAVDGEEWMVRRMFSEDRIRRKFIRRIDGEQIVWNEEGVEKYFRQVRQYKEEEVALVHLDAGAPARATELTSIMRYNPMPGRGRRGIIIEDGLVKFVQGYNKKFRSRKELEIVHRYVPNEIGELVVYGLWLVDPFVKVIRAMARNETQCTPFMWEPPPKEEWGVGENEESGGEESDSEDEQDGVTEAVGEGEGEGEWSEPEEDDHGGDAPVSDERQPGNVDGFYNTDRVRNVLRRETRGRIGTAIGVSVWRHAYPAIQRKYTTDRQVCWIVDRMYDGSGNDKAADWQRIFTAGEKARALQSAHAPRMEEMMYGGTFEEADTSVGSEIRAFRQVSQDWHRFIGWPSASRAGANWELHRQIRREHEEAAFRQWERMRGIDIDGQLREMFNSVAAEFRGIQRPALQAIVRDGRRRVVVIMRTGGGKSLMFMLPARGSPQGTTVVIVPTKSLQQDLKKRCDKLFIKCAVWDRSRPPPFGAQVVIVIAESAVTKSFARFMTVKQTCGQLDRVVVDECHTVLEATPKWRPDMMQLKEMGERGVQVLYLTATLPPTDERQFCEAVGVPEADMTLFREGTSRPNVAYKVMEYKKGTLYEAIRELVEKRLQQYPEADKVVVYCRTIEQTKELAKVLQCRAYYREVGTEEQKGEILTELTEGRERVFTATNALGLGVDAPSIRTVVHTAIPFKLKQYGQESGRAGRDGKASEAIIMRWSVDGEDGRRKRESDWHADEHVKEFVAGERCRRIVLDRHMDGRVDRYGCEPHNGEERCDICSGQPRGEKRRRVWVPGTEERGREDVSVGEEDRRREESRIRYGMERGAEEAVQDRRRAGCMGRRQVVERLERQLEAFRDGCAMCAAQGRKVGGHRMGERCGVSDETMESFEVLSGWLEGIRFERYSGCEGCRVPQAVCHAWEDVDNREHAQFRRTKHGRCQFADVLQEGVAAIMAVRADGAREWLEEKADRDAERIGRIVDEVEMKRRWLGLRFRMHDGVEGSGLCVLFSELAGDPDEFEEVFNEGIVIEEPVTGAAMVPATQCPMQSQSGRLAYPTPARSTPGDNGIGEVRGTQASQAPQASRVDGSSKTEGELAAFRRRVRDWQRWCTLCAANGRTYEHSLWRCTAAGSAEAKEKMRQVQKAYQLEPGAGCRQCMMPYSMCPKYSMDMATGRMRFDAAERCRHNGVIIAGWIGTVQGGPEYFRQEWIDEAKTKGIDEEAAMQWQCRGPTMQSMGRKVEVEGERMCEFALVFSRTIARLERWLADRRSN
jgi:superfamily II DNA helicase RecQ